MFCSVLTANLLYYSATLCNSGTILLCPEHELALRLCLAWHLQYSFLKLTEVYWHFFPYIFHSSLPPLNKQWPAPHCAAVELL